jgi:DNA-binding LacI/PurR family transcriptional regulator
MVGSYVEHGDFSQQSGYEAARRILSRKNRPTAIFSCNDMMAIGCIEYARDAGMTVPGDLAVVGADDIALGSYFKPRLTTLRQPMFDIGCLATRLLLKRLSGSGEWPVEKMVSTELIVRESCGATGAAHSETPRGTTAALPGSRIGPDVGS